MTKIATGYVALRAEVDDLKKDLSKAQSELERSTKTMQGQAVKTSKSFRAMWLAYAAGAAIVAKTAMAAIKAASDLEETTSKFNVVFKGQQKLAEGWSKALVDGYAMSTREAKANLASIQDLLVPMGMAADAAGAMSFEVVKLSADLGSFNNLPTEQVMLDVQSALVGNFETMKKYGVVLNATVVAQKALEMGLVKTKGELTAGTKAQAAYQLMLEGSAAAQGDMERTMDSYANTVKQAGAAWEDLMASLGELILPVATKVVSGLASITKALNDVIESAKEGAGFADKTAEWAEAALAAGGGGSFIPLEEGGAGGGAVGGGGGAAESAQIINMKEVMKQAKALRDEDEEDLYSTLDAQEQYKAEMQAKDIERITTEMAALEEFKAWKGEQRDDELRAQEEAYMAEIDLSAAQIKAIEDMEKEASDKKRKLILADARAQLNIMSNTFLMLSTMAGKYNKLFFRMYQATAIANATIAGVEAAVHAWNAGMKYGYPVAVAFTASSIAYTGAQIAAIASQSMPSAPTGVASVGAGLGSTVAGGDITRPEDEEQRGQINIYIEGDMLADELYLEMLAEKISEAVEGNEVRLIASEVRAT